MLYGFEYKGQIGGITIIDDYAHHPTEITATLTAAQNYPHKNLSALTFWASPVAQR